MGTKLDIIEDNLKLGQVKRITTEDVVDYVELLIGEDTKAQLYYDKDKNSITLELTDTNLDLSNFTCDMKKSTVKSLLRGLKDLYNQLDDIDEVVDNNESNQEQDVVTE